MTTILLRAIVICYNECKKENGGEKFKLVKIEKTFTIHEV